MAIVVAEKIIEMFFIMLCGIVLFKTGLIDDKTVPKLSNILLMLVSPLMIFQSYQMDFDGHLMWGLGPVSYTHLALCRSHQLYNQAVMNERFSYCYLVPGRTSFPVIFHQLVKYTILLEYCQYS